MMPQTLRRYLVSTGAALAAWFSAIIPTALLAQNTPLVAGDAVSVWEARFQGYDADILAALRSSSGGDVLNEIAKARFVPKEDFVRAGLLFEAGCAIGSVKACHNSSNYFGAGMAGVPKDLKRAIAAAKRACDGQFLMSCTSLGFFFLELEDDKPKRARDAAQLWDRACTGGYKPACHSLGITYLIGQGNGLDHAKARQLLATSCAANDERSCKIMNLIEALPPSAMGLKDMGVDIQRALYGGDKGALLMQAGLDFVAKKQDQKAVRVYEVACEMGSGDGCNYAAGFHDGRNNFRVDKSRALMFAERGCTLEHATSCIQQGLILDPIKGSPANQKLAFALFSKACTMKSAVGCSMVGTLYGAGKGIEFSREMSRRYFDQACAMGLQISCGYANDMEAADRASRQASAKRDGERAAWQAIKARFTYPMPTDSNVLTQCFVIKSRFEGEVEAFNARGTRYVQTSANLNPLDPGAQRRRYTEDSERTCAVMLDLAEQSANANCGGGHYTQMMSRIPQFDAVTPYSGPCYHRSLEMGANWNTGG